MIEDARREIELKRVMKIKSTINWIKTNKIFQICKHLFKSYSDLRDYYEMMVFKNMKVSKIKRFFKKKIRRYGPTLDQRTLARGMRTLKFGALGIGMYEESAAHKNAAEIIRVFLHHNKGNHFVKVKIKQTCQRCYNIQNKFREYKQRSDQRLQILYSIFEKEHRKLKALAKSKKNAKRPKEISKTVRDCVLHRYFRFCKDQHWEYFRMWR